MGWVKLLSLGDIKEEYLTEEAKGRLRKLNPSKREPFQSLLSVENLKEELLTEEAKERIRESDQDKLEHPFRYEYESLGMLLVIIVVLFMLAFVIILIFGGK